MTGRPQRPIGTAGKITVRQLGDPAARPKVFEARTYYRDADGHTREVRRRGPSKSSAENELKAALSDRRHTAGTSLSGTSKVAEAGARWLATIRAQVDAGSMAARTLATYESALKLHVLPALGELRLREVTTARCEAWMVELRKRRGFEMCRTSRAVLSGILGYAARMDAIPGNPIRDISPIPGRRKRKPRSMTAAERLAWLDWMDTHPVDDDGNPKTDLIVGRALGDITRFMLATGVRIGEAMAVGWDEVDLKAGTVAICFHIVRVPGVGLVRVDGAKSDAGDRVLQLPQWCIGMLMERLMHARPGQVPVFPDMLGGWRDPNLVMKWIRETREPAGFGWVSSHVFRQTVITVLDDAGLRTREVADQAGHSEIAQTQQYMARKVASERAAQVLEDLLDEPSS